MAGHTKKLNSYMFKGVNYALLVVLLAILQQTSQQNTGKKGVSALLNDFYSRRILNECPQKRYVVLACVLPELIQNYCITEW